MVQSIVYSSKEVVVKQVPLLPTILINGLAGWLSFSMAINKNALKEILYDGNIV